jgi:DNA-binding IclR family transcriptional regulator
MTAAERRSLVNELRVVRDQGYAENIQESESGVCAIGLCVRDPAGDPVAALSVSAPSVRYTPDRSRAFLSELRATVAKAQADISF